MFLFGEDSYLTLSGFVKTIVEILDAKIVRPNWLAADAVRQHDALADPRHEFNFKILLIPDLVNHSDAIKCRQPCEPAPPVRRLEGRRLRASNTAGAPPL